MLSIHWLRGAPAAALFLAAAHVFSACSLLVGSPDDYTYGPAPGDAGRDATPPPEEDGGPPARDGGETDSGVFDGGVAPPPPALRHPSNGLRTGSALTGALDPPRNALRPLFAWDAVSDATGYEIQLTSSCAAGSRDECDFSDAATATSTETQWRPEASLEVSSAAPAGATYVWRVRSCTGVCGDWSEVRYVRVGEVVGDFDGDGHGDVTVGAQDGDGTLMNEGVAHLFAGGATGPTTPSTPFPNPEPATMGRYGWALGSAGDVNGDGFQDLVVGAYLQGQAFVYYGSASGPSASPDVTLTDPLEPTASAFGWAVAHGDFDGDGFDDLVVGAQSHDSPTNAEGAAFVYFGGAGGLGTSPTVIDSPSNQELGQFGFSFGVADLNGDGLVDLLVGAPSYEGDAASEGIAYVFRGRPSGIETSPHWTITHPMPSVGGEFGRSLALGDLDGDFYADAVVAAPFSSDGAANAGSAWVFAGGSGGTPPAGLPVSRPSTEANGFFGDSVAFVGDIDADGLGDIAIGASGFDTPSNNEGLVVVVFGNATLADAAGGPRLVLPPEAREGAFFGGSVSGTDVDADGYFDLIVGAPFFAGSGSAFVMQGGDSGVGAVLGARIDSPSGESGAQFGWGVGRYY